MVHSHWPHSHWPHWALQILDDVEHQGELQMIGFVIVVSMLLGTLLFAVVAMIDGLVHAFR